MNVTTGTNFTADQPRLLYERPEGHVAPDGQRFLAIINSGFQWSIA